MNLVKVENVHFGYPDNPLLLQDISFSVSKGQICTILGRNGAGKSTLLKCIYGILKPTYGNVWILNQLVQKYTYRHLAQKIAVVRQEGNSVFPYTVLESVIMGRNPHLGFFSQPQTIDIQKAYQALEWVGLQNFAHRKIQELSSGERQMVFLARAICQSPKILILDEPNSHLDVANQWHLLRKIQQLCTQEQWSVIAVLHLPELAYWFSNQIILLHQGKILATGTPSQTMTKQNLSVVYDLPMITQQLQQQYLAVYPKELADKEIKKTIGN